MTRFRQIRAIGYRDKILRDDIRRRQDEVHFTQTEYDRAGQLVGKKGKFPAVAGYRILSGRQEQKLFLFVIRAGEVLCAGIPPGGRIDDNNALAYLFDTEYMVDACRSADIGFITQFYIAAQVEVDDFIEMGKINAGGSFQRRLYELAIVFIKKGIDKNISRPALLFVFKLVTALYDACCIAAVGGVADAYEAGMQVKAVFKIDAKRWIITGAFKAIGPAVVVKSGIIRGADNKFRFCSNSIAGFFLTGIVLLCKQAAPKTTACE